MKRVVVTGMGIVSCLGDNQEAVLESLQNGRSGIRTQSDYVEIGMRSQIAGYSDVDTADHIDRKVRRFMGDSAAYAYIAMAEAVKQSGLTEDMISNPRTGIVVGSGGGAPAVQTESLDKMRASGVKKIGPYTVPKTMCSTTSACLATPFKIKGVNYTMSSACATSAHCIGHAMELIQMGKQDVVFAGGGEEESWSLSMMFDAMGALSTKYNEAPETASRPFDVDRDGFVIAGGGGMLVIESLDHALARGANILAELVGYGATSDGFDMVAPSGEGAIRCMEQALSTVDGDVDYVNAHGTSTPVGDAKELNAIKTVFKDKVPKVSSTKSMSGHSLGAAGVHEAVYTLLMLNHGFIAPTINTKNLDPAAEGVPIVLDKEITDLNIVMSNSFGFGGTNATLVFKRYA